MFDKLNAEMQALEDSLHYAEQKFNEAQDGLRACYSQMRKVKREINDLELRRN